MRSLHHAKVLTFLSLLGVLIGFGYSAIVFIFFILWIPGIAEFFAVKAARGMLRLCFYIEDRQYKITK